jgi:hypothetical protein
LATNANRAGFWNEQLWATTAQLPANVRIESGAESIGKGILAFGLVGLP